jgi:hypothetical protein
MVSQELSGFIAFSAVVDATMARAAGAGPSAAAIANDLPVDIDRAALGTVISQPLSCSVRNVLKHFRIGGEPFDGCLLDGLAYWRRAR